MDDRIANRVMTVANSILKSKGTVRSIAAIHGVSKSTVHKDLTERLYELDINLFDEVRKLLDFNKSVRHLRGGHSTKLKYLHKK